MPGPTEHHSRPLQQALAPPQVALRWAELARALTLYPETSARATSCLEALQRALAGDDAANPRDVEVAFSATACWIGGEAHEIQDNRTLLWLRDRLFRSHLTGAIFERGVTAAAVLAFTKRLLALYLRRDLGLSFEDLWSEPSPGIVPLERCFDGTFGTAVAGAAPRDVPMVPSPGRQQNRTLNEKLARNDAVRAQVEALQSSVIELAGGEEHLVELDLLTEIAALLPEEGLHDHDLAAEMTLDILNELRLRLTEAPLPVEQAQHRDDASFLRLFAVIGRSHFSRTLAKYTAKSAGGDTPQRAEDAPGAPASPRVEPELPAAELEALASEMNAAVPRRIDAREIDDPLEQLGAYLHVLVTCEDPRALPGLEAGLLRLVQASGRGANEVLRRTLEPHRSGSAPESSAKVSRLISCLTGAGLRRQLRSLGVFDPEWVSQAFPDEFPGYLKGIDFSDPADRDELDLVCRKIGPRRFRQAPAWLDEQRELVAGPFPRALMTNPRASTVPLARLLFLQDPDRFRPDFARFLRVTAAKGPDQQVLDLVHDPALLPVEYLSAVADPAGGPLEHQRELCLHSIIAATEGVPALLAILVRAVHLLVHCDSAKTRGLLERLRRERRHVLLRKHPKAVRDAAARALATLARSGGAPRV